jgi:deoxyribonuclease-4
VWTCHLWEAGYDIVNSLDDVLQEFDRIVGLDKLYAIHLNDSKNPIAAHKDRHELLGEGHIGSGALSAVITHPLLQGKPFILETPNDDAGYAREIAWVRSVMK